MEVSSEKSKTMANSENTEHANISMNGEQLEDVEKFKYLGAILSKDGSCTAEVRARIGNATSAMTKLNRIWKSNIRLSTKLKLYKALVVSIVLYGCETWTLTAALEKKIQAFETKCMRKILRISWTEHKTND